jgi:muconate cycloisomerase
MKITSLETIPIRVPLKPQLAIRGARGLAHLVSPFLLVRVHTDDGLTGLGESSCTPRWSGEDQVSAAHFIRSYFAPLLIGEAIDDVERLNAKFASAVAGNYFTKSAIEMALWDLLGKARNKPVYELLGGKQRESVGTKWSVSGVEPAKAAEIAQWAVAQGFTAMKVKGGIEPGGDVARLRAVRDAVGPAIKLGVDANGGWPTPRVAIDTIQTLYDRCAIAFAEQPIKPGDNDALREVRQNIPVPLIADESVYTLEDAQMLARAEAADVFSIYIGKAGGIGPARQIADFAHSAGVKCTLGSNLELGVGTAAMIHFALSSPALDPDAYPCDIIGPLYYEDDVVEPAHAIDSGQAIGANQNGLGIALRADKVLEYQVPSTGD